MDRPGVVLHTFGFQEAGGPAAIVRYLLSSRLSEVYSLSVVSQERPARGINWSLIREMASKIKAAKPALVHISGLQNEGFHGMAAARLAGCHRTLLAVHGFMEDAVEYPVWKKAIVGGVLEPITLRLASAVYCVCEHGARRAKVRRHARTNLGVIHNGVPLLGGWRRDWEKRRALGFGDKDVLALCVCRISVDKGLLVLADALHRLEGVGASQPKLLLVGEGPDMPRVRAAFGSLVQRGRVVMLGHRKDVPELHALSDLFVLPTLHENLSMAVLEAMAAGRAVLTTEVGGNPELVEHGKSGFLVPVQDSSALAKGLEELAGSEQLRKEMGQAGRARTVAAFSLERLASQLGEVYECLLSGRVPLGCR